MATTGTHPQTALALTSPAFRSGERIPTEYTADGRNVSPPLKWAGVPTGAKSLALVCEDPDAPKGLFVHWVAFNIPPQVMEFGAGVRAEETLSDGTTQGTNGFGKLGYGGPSPPAGKPHRYIFRLYALDEQLELPAGTDRDGLLAALQGHVLGQGELIGTYGRSAT